MADLSLGYRMVDADNHIYETEDCLTRYLPEEHARRIYWVTSDFGHRKLVLDGQVYEYIPNCTFDPVAVPGALVEMYRDNKGREELAADSLAADRMVEPLAGHPEYQDAAARLRVMDEQQVEAAIFFPTLVNGVEEVLKHDPDLLYAAFDSFNRWMVDEWPFAHQGRLFTLPLISLVDVGRAISQLEHAIEHGAVAFFLRAGPVPCADGYRSPGDLRFDPFWARVEEAGMAVIVHSSDAGYGDVVARWEAEQDPNGRAGITQSLYSWFTGSEGGRGVSDTVTALIVHGVFGRFPGLRFLSVENGSEWVVPLLQMLKKHSVHYAGRFTGDPVEQFHQNLWVCPFWEEDIESLARHVRIERICAGSDWPHPEGTVQPLDYIDGLKAFSPGEQRRIMRENTLELLGVTGGG